MTISYISRFVLATLLAGIGGSLVFTKVDRPMLALSETEGVAHALLMKEGTVYEQSIVVTKPSLSKIGFVFSTTKPADSNIIITAYSDQKKIGEALLPAVFISSGNITYASFSPVLPVSIGQTITLRIAVPTELSDVVRIQQRESDGTFDEKQTQFSINGELQANPLAYEAFYAYRLPFAVQLGGILLFASLWILLWPHTRHQYDIWLVLYAIWISMLYALPQLLIGMWPILLIVGAIAAFLGMVQLVRYQGGSLPASLLSAHVFAFTSWFALQIGAGRTYYILIALLPIVVLFGWYWKNISLFWRIVFSVCVLLTVGTWFTHISEAVISKPVALSASIRDVLFDPNQIGVFDKLSSSQFQEQTDARAWNHFGAYLGLPAALFALLGLISSWKTSYKFGITFLLLAAVVFLPITIRLLLPLPLPIAPQHVSIGLVLIAALLAARGFDVFYRFLGNKDPLVTGMMYVMIAILVFDTLHVATVSLEPFTS